MFDTLGYEQTEALDNPRGRGAYVNEAIFDALIARAKSVTRARVK